MESEALACHSPALLGEAGGRGRRLSSPPLLPFLQTSADLFGRRCSASTPAPSRHLPLGVGNQEGPLLSECVKQRPAGFPGRKPGSGLHTGTRGQGLRESGLGPSTRPIPIPSFLPPKFSPLPPRESALGEGPEGRGLGHPSTALLCPSPGLSNLTSPSCRHLGLSTGPSQPYLHTPAHPAVRIVLDSTRGGGSGGGREGSERKAEIHSHPE